MSNNLQTSLTNTFNLMEGVHTLDDLWFIQLRTKLVTFNQVSPHEQQMAI